MVIAEMTKSQLIDEVNSLRKQVAELESRHEQLQSAGRLHDLPQFYMNAPVGLCLLDRELRYVHINKMLADINGLPVADHIGRTVREVIPEIADVIEPIYQKIIETREPQTGIRVVGKTQRDTNGDHHYLVSYIPYLTEQGEIQGFSSVVQDITEQAAAEESSARARQELHDVLNSVELLNAIVEGTTDAIYVKNTKGKHLLANSSCAEVMGKTHGEILGKDDMELFPPHIAEKLMEADRCIMAEGEPKLVEEVVTPAGSNTPRTFQSMKAPLKNSEGEVIGMFGISRDVTDHRLADEQVRQLTADLQHASRLSMMGEMAAGVAHELHQPLSIITNYANGSRRRLEEGNVDVGRLVESMQKIADAGMCAGEITARIKGFLSKEEMTTAPLNVNDAVRDALALAAIAVRDHNVVVVTSLADGLPQVAADRIQLIQVVLNLVLNGIEAMADVEKPHLKVSTSCGENRWVQVKVTDSGGGVNLLDGESVFDPFVTSKPNGLGLGLSISRTIVEAHGGEISYESEQPSGTSFRFSLPPSRL